MKTRRCAELLGSDNIAEFEDVNWFECSLQCCENFKCKSFQHRHQEGVNCILHSIGKDELGNNGSFEAEDSCSLNSWSYNEIVDNGDRQKKQVEAASKATTKTTLTPTKTTTATTMNTTSTTVASETYSLSTTRVFECKVNPYTGSGYWFGKYKIPPACSSKFNLITYPLYLS